MVLISSVAIICGLLLFVLYKLHALLKFMQDSKALEEVIREKKHSREKGEVFVYDAEQERREDEMRDADNKGKDIKLIDLLKDDYEL